jgi:hypothetical protein
VWSRDAEKIRITYTDTVKSEDLSSQGDRVEVTQEGIVIREIAGAAGVVAVSVPSTQVYLDGPRTGESEIRQSADVRGDAWRMLDLEQRLPIDAAEFAQDTHWAGFASRLEPSADGQVLAASGVAPLQDAFVLGTGGAATSLTGNGAYTLRISDRKLIVSPAGQDFPIEYVRLARASATGEERWLMLTPAVAQSIYDFHAYSIAVLPFGALPALSTASVARDWESVRDSTGLVVHRLYNDGIGAQLSTSPDGRVVARPTTWRTDSGSIVITRPVSSNPLFSNLLRVRTWLPLSAQGKSLWVLDSTTEVRADGQSVTLLIWIRRLTDLGPPP